jgi:hypothetical protein
MDYNTNLYFLWYYSRYPDFLKKYLIVGSFKNAYN